MGNIPDDVLGALVKRMADEEGLSESDIANRLTDDYGGGLPSNALRIYHMLGNRSSSSTDARDPLDHQPSSRVTMKATRADDSARVKRYSFDTPMPPRSPGPPP